MAGALLSLHAAKMRGELWRPLHSAGPEWEWMVAAVHGQEGTGRSWEPLDPQAMTNRLPLCLENSFWEVNMTCFTHILSGPFQFLWCAAGLWNYPALMVVFYSDPELIFQWCISLSVGVLQDSKGSLKILVLSSLFSFKRMEFQKTLLSLTELIW